MLVTKLQEDDQKLLLDFSNEILNKMKVTPRFFQWNPQ